MKGYHKKVLAIDLAEKKAVEIPLDEGLLLKYVYDPGNPVQSDDGFADRLFEGAIEFLAKTGVYCDATNHIIHLDRGEIVRAIENLPEGRAFGGPGNGASSSRGGLGMKIPRGVV